MSAPCGENVILFALTVEDLEDAECSPEFIEALTANTERGKHLRSKLTDKFSDWSRWFEFLEEAESLLAPYMEEA